jgi:hypothetical protein
MVKVIAIKTLPKISRPGDVNNLRTYVHQNGVFFILNPDKRV